MATLIGDTYGGDSSRFHSIMGGSTLQHQHSHDHYPAHVSVGRARERDVPSHHAPADASARRSRSAQHPAQNTPTQGGREATPVASSEKTTTNGDASRLPSPPESASPSEASLGSRPQHGLHAPVEAAPTTLSAGGSAASCASTAATVVVAAPARSIPSPQSDGTPNLIAASSTSEAMDGASSSTTPTPQTTIHLRDLAHVQSLARSDKIPGGGRGTLRQPPLQQMKYDISAMPIGDIIEMVAALLTKITTTNDLQHDALNRNAAHIRQAQSKHEDGEAGLSQLSSSVLAFHGKNVPAITILSYLTRIHKYCPTTYEVFLSLLVYFDRMADKVNEEILQTDKGSATRGPAAASPGTASHDADPDTAMRDGSGSGSEASDDVSSDLADDDNDGENDESPSSSGDTHKTAGTGTTPAVVNPSTFFVVDSFNIHRLIIAGVTCASKFFSDVFYTNSRYAKVGGLPLPELNHLELQFLLLNEFQLFVLVEDLEAYATMLVEFYAREVISGHSGPDAGAE